MGRVHKKKLAQYKDSEGADDEQSVASKDESGRGDEDRDDDKSAANNSDAEVEDLTAGDSKKSASKEDSEHEDDSDADGGDTDVEEKPSTKNGKRAPKRKPGPKKTQKNDSDADDDDADDNENGDAIEENGGTPAKRGRKSAGGKKKVSPAKGGRKTKTPNKNDTETDDEKNDEDDDENEEEYEVKDVVGHKVEKGVTFYLIRWKGYTKDDDTWESEETLSCQDLIDKYNKKNNTSKSSKTTPGKKSTENNVKRKGRPVKKSGKEAKKEEDPDKEWEVDKILDYAEEKDGRVFRIRWKGYGPKGDTWEPEKNLSCSDLIEKFMKKMNAQKDVSFKELRETPKKTKRLLNETAPRSDPSARKSKRSAGKKRIMYADSDE